MQKEKIIDLDECVINALEMFRRKSVPKINFLKRKVLVVGSGNAAVTGKIIFSESDAVFADESDYKQVLKSHKVDSAYIISASGGKHSPKIARYLRKRGTITYLITNNGMSRAGNVVNKVFVFPKNTEPYTYNTSTYMGMILSKTKENTGKILNFVKKIKVPSNIGKYDSFYFIVPDEFEEMKEMYTTKFDELFGSKISGRAFSVEQTKHAKNIVNSEKELFISLGYSNKIFGKRRFNVPLYKGIDYVGMMAVGYYIIGKIQKANKPWFKENIVKYTKKASKIFGEEIRPIVE